jgi:VCBS repeat-containing protein
MNVKVNGHTIRTGTATVNVLTSSPYTANEKIGYTVLLANCTSGNIIVNLSTAANNTDCFVIKKTDSTQNVVTITPNSVKELIDGSSTATISVQYTSLTLVSDGSNWYII